MKRVLRHEIPVDDQWHTLPGCYGEPTMIGARTPYVVEVWQVHDDDAEPLPGRTVRVYGTGHEIPAGTAVLGSTIVDGGVLVWHLVERLGPERP